MKCQINSRISEICKKDIVWMDPLYLQYKETIMQKRNYVFNTIPSYKYLYENSGF